MAGKRKAPPTKNPLTTKQGPSQATVIGIIVVVAFAALVGFGVYWNSQPGEFVVPRNATAQGVPTGNEAAPNKIDIYLDFQCPACKQFEEISGTALDELRDTGQAQIIYHPIAILDRVSPDQYSSRSAAASGCAADAGVFRQFEKLLYANQPTEGDPGLTTEQLTQFAQQAGAGPDIGQCISDERYEPWAQGITQQAFQAQVQSTPTVLVNGQKVDNPTPDGLRQALAR
ncbi:thioredoxin domain-containing protein [Pseudonocardia sp. C8]|uniref:DsbA family protein n=1 Tax=Pseudonocardia sp. C8 TaxID=2762759 RepID=UPI0016431A5F|nr:thioredoxin domain-containing protein [Pseudonocardia sp. C8]MBC3194251.1 thioredoxin domain-containing protein [Pseudonocardia sp. C8]